MNTLYAGIHIQGSLSSELTLDNIDFNRNVDSLKKEIAEKLSQNSEEIGKKICNSLF